MKLSPSQKYAVFVVCKHVTVLAPLDCQSIQLCENIHLLWQCIIQTIYKRVKRRCGVNNLARVCI